MDTMYYRSMRDFVDALYSAKRKNKKVNATFVMMHPEDPKKGFDVRGTKIQSIEYELSFSASGKDHIIKVNEDITAHLQPAQRMTYHTLCYQATVDLLRREKFYVISARMGEPLYGNNDHPGVLGAVELLLKKAAKDDMAKKGDASKVAVKPVEKPKEESQPNKEAPGKESTPEESAPRKNRGL